MATTWYGGLLEIYEAASVAITPVTVAFKTFTLNNDPVLDDVTTTAYASTRKAGTTPNNKWDVEFPYDTDNLPEALLLLAAGAVLSLRWTVNPSALVGSQKKYLLKDTTVGPADITADTEKRTRFKRSGEGGDLTTPT